MLRACDGHVFIDIKLFLSVNVFKIPPPPLGVSGPKNKIFPKPEVNHKKVKIHVFALDIAFNITLLILTISMACDLSF